MKKLITICFVMSIMVYLMPNAFGNIHEGTSQMYLHDVSLLADGDGMDTVPIFPVGTKWTYEYYPHPVNPNDIIHSYITYEVTDTLHINDTIVYTVVNNRNKPVDRMIQSRNKVWFWDTGVDGWQLSYEFGETRFYGVPVGDSELFQEAIVHVDSMGTYAFGGRGDQAIQHVNIYPNYTWEDPLVLSILHHCGNLDGGGQSGLKLGVGLNLWDPNPYYSIGKLRCFEQGDFFHNFSDSQLEEIACDSVWTEVLSSTSEAHRFNIAIYPNPTHHEIFIEGTDANLYYEIFTLEGKLVKNGQTEKSAISGLPAGMMILRLYMDDRMETFRVIKFE